MSESAAAEAVLAQFLESVRRETLSTWRQQRTAEQLGSFVNEKLQDLYYKDPLDDDLEGVLL